MPQAFGGLLHADYKPTRGPGGIWLAPWTGRTYQALTGLPEETLPTADPPGTTDIEGVPV